MTKALETHHEVPRNARADEPAGDNQFFESLADSERHGTDCRNQKERGLHAPGPEPIDHETYGYLHPCEGQEIDRGQ